MSENIDKDAKVKNAELYIFDDIDEKDIQLQNVKGDMGHVSIKGSILEHTQIVDDVKDYKINKKVQISLSRVDQSKRFRYATDDSKPDGIGILLRCSENDFVITSINQDLGSFYHSIESEI